MRQFDTDHCDAIFGDHGENRCRGYVLEFSEYVKLFFNPLAPFLHIDPRLKDFCANALQCSVRCFSAIMMWSFMTVIEMLLLTDPAKPL